MEIYKTTYDVLKPEIDKLLNFYDFQVSRCMSAITISLMMSVSITHGNMDDVCKHHPWKYG